MARSSLVSMLLLAAVACWAFSSCFVAAPLTEKTEPQMQSSSLRGDPAAAAVLGAVVAAAPQAAMAGNSGYALLQLGWAIFIISLGPAVSWLILVLFWIYFNKPELL